MKMRKIAGLLVGLALVFVSSCTLPEKELIDTQLKQFASDLSNNRGNCYNSVHPDALNYNASKAASFWDTAVNSTAGTYTISSVDANSSSNVTGNLSGPGGYNKNFTASFKKSGDAMKMMNLNLGSGDVLN